MNDVKSIRVVYRDIDVYTGVVIKGYSERKFNPPLKDVAFVELINEAFASGAMVIVEDDLSLLIPTTNIITIEINHEE